MTKVKVKIPEIKFSKETIEVPTSRVEQVRKALVSQQARVNDQLAKRNEAVIKKVNKATGRSSRRFSPGKLGLLGLGALLGVGAGILASPTTGRNARALLFQKGGKAARVASQQTASATKLVGAQAKGRAAAVRSKVSTNGEVDLGPETITDRVQTQLGDDTSLRHLPRINVNTEPGGIVYLRGPVPSESERERAEKIARKQKGVTEVINELHVQGADAVQ